ncbi:deoxyribonuclease I [secondary endosymbiont of Trabutina mannipara]|uniref:deoxyribonuclease I n=1 Tax=secondary endosymbiont of Trabutina mannipara TaxID=1835721 RepID=UPI0009F5A606|nr:deoxyribonuclease I [secondary endosymbiont of Trabutina mannipara]
MCSLVIYFFYTTDKVYNIENFNQAKSVALKINRDAPGTFYCGCPITWYGKKGTPDLSTCGYQVRKSKLLAKRIEWEHVMPAWEFGHQRQCWKKGGRKNCAKDFAYRKIENDLHNLQPVIGEVNKDRGNYQYSQWYSGKSQYGRCQMKIDFKNKQIDPPTRVRGVIARTYFYMRDHYKLRLSRAQTKLFELWNHTYPVTEWECKRNKRIAAIQGNPNPYIQLACNSKIKNLN